jgi:hypothetical protein
MKKDSIEAIMLLLLVLLCSNMNAQCPNVNPMYQDLVTWRNSNIQNGVSHNIIKVQITVVKPCRGDHYGYTAWAKSTLLPSIGTANAQCNLGTGPTVFIRSDEIYESNSRIQPFSNKTEHIIRERFITLDMVGNRIIDNISLPNNKYSEQIFSDLTRVGDVIYGTNNGDIIILNLRKSTYTDVFVYRTLEKNKP